MRLAKRYLSDGAKMPYLLDTHDGRFCASDMPATVALEIVRSADTLKTCDREGYGLLVDGDMLFPADAFEFDEGEGPTAHVHLATVGEKQPRPERPCRPKKRELLEKARSMGLRVTERMTNAYLTQLIEDAGGWEAADADQGGSDTEGA